MSDPRSFRQAVSGSIRSLTACPTASTLPLGGISGLEDARAKIEAYRVDYNEVRPHGSLDNRTPMEFARSITGLAPVITV